MKQSLISLAVLSTLSFSALADCRQDWQDRLDARQDRRLIKLVNDGLSQDQDKIDGINSETAKYGANAANGLVNFVATVALSPVALVEGRVLAARRKSVGSRIELINNFAEKKSDEDTILFVKETLRKDSVTADEITSVGDTLVELSNNNEICAPKKNGQVSFANIDEMEDAVRVKLGIQTSKEVREEKNEKLKQKVKKFFSKKEKPAQESAEPEAATAP